MVRYLLVATLVLPWAPGCARGRAGPDPRDTVQADVARRAHVTTTPPLEESNLGAQPLTQDAAVKLALVNNPEVREIYERLGIARADLIQAGLLRNPVFSLDSKFFSAGPELELGLAQSFVDLFFIPMRRRVAGSELFAEQCAVARDLVRLIYDVRRAFVRVFAADAVVALHEEGLARALASRDLMRKLHEAGNALDTVRTLEEADAGRAQLDLDASRLRAIEAREPLLVLLGLEVEPSGLVLAGPAPTPSAGPPPPSLERLAVDGSLDLLEDRARLQAAACRLGLVRREGLLPELDLGVVGKREADGAWGLGPAVSLALPIFDHGQARRLAAHAELRRLGAHEEHTRIAVRSAARRFGRRLVALRDRERHLREVYLPLREQLIREGLQFYNAMQIGAFDILRAKRLQIDAQREHVETRREALLAELDVHELLAGSLNHGRIEGLDLPDEAAHPEAPKGH